MRLLTRKRGARPRAKTIRPAERYLTAGATEARRLECSFVGTEHVVLAVAHDRASGGAALLGRLGADPHSVESALAPWLGPSSERAKIDPDALASLEIDFDAVRARIEGTFGTGALERASASCLGIAPRLKLALAHALDHAGDVPLRNEHVLLGIFNVPDSVGARALVNLGISADDVRAVLPPESFR
jgi:ATP-dependent Clp protease ATP-binding subunit ClpA